MIATTDQWSAALLADPSRREPSQRPTYGPPPPRAPRGTTPPGGGIGSFLGSPSSRALRERVVSLARFQI